MRSFSAVFYFATDNYFIHFIKNQFILLYFGGWSFGHITDCSKSIRCRAIFLILHRREHSPLPPVQLQWYFPLLFPPLLQECPYSGGAQMKQLHLCAIRWRIADRIPFNPGRKETPSATRVGCNLSEDGGDTHQGERENVPHVHRHFQRVVDVASRTLNHQPF